jgi:hypothetical protein
MFELEQPRPELPVLLANSLGGGFGDPAGNDLPELRGVAAHEQLGHLARNRIDRLGGWLHDRPRITDLTPRCKAAWYKVPVRRLFVAALIALGPACSKEPKARPDGGPARAPATTALPPEAPLAPSAPPGDPPSFKLGPTARKVSLDPSEVAAIFAPFPELADIELPIRFFDDPDDTATVLRRGKATSNDLDGFTLTTKPLVWNPAAGQELLVILGHGAKDSFIVALNRLSERRYSVASTMRFKNDLGPFALGWNRSIRERIVWSACWKCPGEEGTVSLRDGKRVIIVQQ